MKPAEMIFQFWPGPLPWLLVAAGIILSLLLVLRLIASRSTLRHLFHHFILRRPTYDYPLIIRQHLECFNTIRDRRELSHALLSAAIRIVHAEGASLLVREDGGEFLLKAAQGVKPSVFDVSEARRFFAELEKRRGVVTRRALVGDRSWGEVKSEGLRYCVQFHCEACVPLFVDDRLFGVANLGRRPGPYDSDTCQVLELLATQFAIALHNASLYQTLMRKNLHLEDMGRLKNQLLANVSHELRTPLTSIIGLSEMMAEGADGPVNEEQMEHLSMIRQSGVRLLETVSSMLDISKIEANQLTLSIHKIDLRRLIENVLGTVSVNDHTHVSIELDAHTPGIYGDEPRIRQVLKHLLENAAKFTKRGSISIAAERSGEMLKICVRDTGIGIEPNMQKQIFEGFIQADGSVTREYQGLGLGLTIARRIIELHGGRLWLLSKVGRGSRFYFTLPLKPIGLRHPELPQTSSVVAFEATA